MSEVEVDTVTETCVWVLDCVGFRKALVEQCEGSLLTHMEGNSLRVSTMVDGWVTAVCVPAKKIVDAQGYYGQLASETLATLKRRLAQ